MTRRRAICRRAVGSPNAHFCRTPILCVTRCKPILRQRRCSATSDSVRPQSHSNVFVNDARLCPCSRAPLAPSSTPFDRAPRSHRVSCDSLQVRLAYVNRHACTHLRIHSLPAPFDTRPHRASSYARPDSIEAFRTVSAQPQASRDSPRCATIDSSRPDSRSPFGRRRGFPETTASASLGARQLSS
jgi:hypothetical protein